MLGAVPLAALPAYIFCYFRARDTVTACNLARGWRWRVAGHCNIEPYRIKVRLYLPCKKHSDLSKVEKR